MNLLTMMMLAVLVPNAGADTENAAVWVRVSSNHIEIFATPEDAKAVLAKSGEGIFVECTSMKINVTAEGNIFEFGNCAFHTSTGKNGTANSAVFDQGKGILTLTGDEATPVHWSIQSDTNGEPKSVIVSQSMKIIMVRSESIFTLTTGVLTFDETNESSLDRFRRRYTQLPQNDKDF